MTMHPIDYEVKLTGSKLFDLVKAEKKPEVTAPRAYSD